MTCTWRSSPTGGRCASHSGRGAVPACCGTVASRDQSARQRERFTDSRLGSRAEVPAGLAERTLSKAQCLEGGQLVDQRYPMIAEGAIVGDLEGPVAAVLRQERISHLPQERQVSRDDSLAVQH